MGRFTIIAKKEGYEEDKKYQMVTTKRNTTFGIGIFHLKKIKTRQLNEAVVHATHIKMVMRGDTVVYDAAAFDLAEGRCLTPW